jgi:predicted DNA binding protein/GAF domain-containing protein/PAS domain-containing protein
MTGFRALLVCDQGGVRASFRSSLEAEIDGNIDIDTAGVDSLATDETYDCVIGVPDERDPATFAGTLDAQCEAPVVVFSDAPAEDLLDRSGVTDVVQRHGEESYTVLADRIEQAVRQEPLSADGGTGADPLGTADHPLGRITDGVIALDSEWTVTYLNDAARETIDRPTVELIGQPLWEVFPEAVGTSLQTEFEVAMETQESRTVEEYVEDLDLWVEVRAYPSEDGLTVLFQEITDRKRAREELEASEDSLQQLHDLASATDLEPMEKVSRILDVGRDRLGVDIGFLTRIESGTQEIVEATGGHPELYPGAVAPLEEAYCRRTVGQEEPLAVDNAIEEGWADDPAYERFGLACYLGATIAVDGEEYGTVCFADTETRDATFTEAEKTFVDLVTDWVSFVLTQREYEETLKARGRQLSGILEKSRSLMQARSREEVAELMAAAARDVLGYELTVVRLYDADAETLVPAGTTQASENRLGERPVYKVGEGYPGEVFATGEPRIVDDLADEDSGAARSAMYYPVGVHGTISVGATEPGAFDERDQQVLGLLATSAAAACTRAKREQEVREAREHVETVLERVNGIVESTVEVLVGATTRDELEAGVVEELARAEPYAFAWLGRPDLASETITPTAWAGDAGIPASDLEFALDGEGPVAQAYREEELQLVHNVSSEPADAVCAGATACEGVESAIVVPLTYKDTSYGVLAVFADEAGAFDEREQVILDALGGAIANAINAVERGRILDADKVIEVEFGIDDTGLLFNRLSREGGCRVESAGTDYRADGTLKMYLTAEGADGERLVELAREDEAVLDASLITDHEDGTLLEVTVDESLVATLSEYGAVTTSVVAENGSTRFTVELPYEAEARGLYDLIEDRYPGTDLVGYHEHERPIETRQEFRAALAERFTDRQETALQTAYLGGFFEWPRQIDGNELAEAMGISRPTYHQHLRAAQKKVLEELFEQSI